MIDQLWSAIAHFVSIAAALDWMQWLLLWGLAFLVYILYRCQVAEDTFDLRHLIVDPGSNRIDRFAFGYMVGLVFVSWFFLYYTQAGKMTEWFAALCVVYWGAPKSIEAWMNARRGA